MILQSMISLVTVREFIPGALQKCNYSCQRFLAAEESPLRFANPARRRNTHTSLCSLHTTLIATTNRPFYMIDLFGRTVLSNCSSSSSQSTGVFGVVVVLGPGSLFGFGRSAAGESRSLNILNAAEDADDK